jgi:hypothetical protein
MDGELATIWSTTATRSRSALSASASAAVASVGASPVLLLSAPTVRGIRATPAHN